MLSPMASARASGSDTKKRSVRKGCAGAFLLGVPNNNNNSCRSYIAAYALNSVSFAVSRYHTRKNIAICCMVMYSDTSLSPAVSCTRWSPSDHFPVFTRLSINPAPLPPPTLHSFRRLHSIDIGPFLTDLESSQLIIDTQKSFGPLLSAYDTTLSSLLDKYAPIVTKLSRRQSIKPLVFYHPPCISVHPPPC